MILFPLLPLLTYSCHPRYCYVVLCCVTERGSFASLSLTFLICRMGVAMTPRVAGRTCEWASHHVWHVTTVEWLPHIFLFQVSGFQAGADRVTSMEALNLEFADQVLRDVKLWKQSWALKPEGLGFEFQLCHL